MHQHPPRGNTMARFWQGGCTGRMRRRENSRAVVNEASASSTCQHKVSTRSAPGRQAVSAGSAQGQRRVGTGSAPGRHRVGTQLHTRTRARAHTGLFIPFYAMRVRKWVTDAEQFGDGCVCAPARLLQEAVVSNAMAVHTRHVRVQYVRFVSLTATKPLGEQGGTVHVSSAQD